MTQNSDSTDSSPTPLSGGDDPQSAQHSRALASDEDGPAKDRELAGRALPVADSSISTTSATKTEESAEEDRVHETKPGDITTIEGLLIYGYEQQGKRFTIPNAVFEIIAARRGPEPDEPDPVLALVADLSADEALATTVVQLQTPVQPVTD